MGSLQLHSLFSSLASCLHSADSFLFDAKELLALNQHKSLQTTNIIDGVRGGATYFVAGKKTNFINLLKHEKMHNITFLYCGTLSIVLQATGQKPDIALLISHSSMST